MNMYENVNRWRHFRSSNHKIAFLTPKKVAPKFRTLSFHPFPPDQNVLIFNYKKIGFQVDPLLPFRTMSLNILFFLEPSLMVNWSSTPVVDSFLFFPSSWGTGVVVDTVLVSPAFPPDFASDLVMTKKWKLYDKLDWYENKSDFKFTFGKFLQHLTTYNN